jgi:RimJ/RimL family protein N-acetyltransferase
VQASEVALRPFDDIDVELLVRFAVDPSFSGPFQWNGFRSPEEFRRRFLDDGFLQRDPHQLVVAWKDEPVGWMAWRDPLLFGRPGSSAEIGIVLAPEHRGLGIGRAAHPQLRDYLFATMPVHRLTANTDVDNVAERCCLERCGFRVDGILRRAGFRDGAWRDVAAYSLLREERR